MHIPVTGKGAGQLTTSLAGAFPDSKARQGALSSVSGAFLGGLHHACQAVLHPLESFQSLSGPRHDPLEAPSLGRESAQKVAEQEDEEEPRRSHQVLLLNFFRLLVNWSRLAHRPCDMNE